MTQSFQFHNKRPNKKRCGQRYWLSHLSLSFPSLPFHPQSHDPPALKQSSTISSHLALPYYIFYFTLLWRFLVKYSYMRSWYCLQEPFPIDYLFFLFIFSFFFFLSFSLSFWALTQRRSPFRYICPKVQHKSTAFCSIKGNNRVRASWSRLFLMVRLRILG